MRCRHRVLVRAFVVASVVSALGACTSADFDPMSTIKSVRVMAARSSAPYARPGEDVELEVLGYDGRAEKPEPMHVWWIPFVCKNPYSDLYYACFATLAGGAAPPSAVTGNGGGAESGPPSNGGNQLPPALAAILKPGFNLSPFLTEGSKFRFTMPSDVVTSHPRVEGTSAPYGMVVVFNILCAGHVEVVERDPKNPVSPPIGCFNAEGKQLGADDYAIGFSRVYAYDERRNQNPEIAGVLADGAPVDLRGGLTFDRCTVENEDDCQKVKLTVDVPETSQEINESDIDPRGAGKRELIWSSWFTTHGKITKNENQLLYEPRAGRITTDNETELRLPKESSEGHLFVVVHDNRGGASWLEMALHIR